MPAAAARKLAIIMHRLSVEGFLFGTRPPYDCAARKIAARMDLLRNSKEQLLPPCVVWKSRERYSPHVAETKKAAQSIN